MSEDAALEPLRAILARPEFQPNASVPWWERLFGPVLSFLGGLWLQLVTIVLGAASRREGWLDLVVLVACGLVALLVLVYLARTVRQAIGRESRLRREGLAARRERSERLWQQAQRLAAEGRLSEAVRLVYLSALYALDERAVLHVQSGLTNSEHAARLSRDHPDVGTIFSALVERYDRLRYGHYAVTTEAFAELSALVARARSAAGVVA